MEEKKSKYFIGLDIGTNSCGWAATDEDYNPLRLKGKSAMGVILFKEANPAQERRAKRTSRIRLARRRERIKLLRDLFMPEISKTDNAFFERLDASALWAEDKPTIGKYTLFNDPAFSDKEYHKKYKTIYHLKQDLRINGTTDPRLLYLAAHHIIKYRGHFLLDGQNFNSEAQGKQVFENLNAYLADEEIDISFSVMDFAGVERIALDQNMKSRERISAYMSEFGLTDKRAQCMVAAFCGNAVKPKDLFDNEEYADEKSFKFSDSGYEEKSAELEGILGYDYTLVALLKDIYDWSVLTRLTKGEKYLSDAMIKIYEKHASDLAKLKSFVKQYFPEEKHAIFSDPAVKDNYCAYAGVAKAGGKKLPLQHSAASREDFYKFLTGIFKKKESELAEDKVYKEILSDIENNTFLPKTVSKDNASVPYQLNLIELRAILEKCRETLPFLLSADDSGWSVEAKIISLLTFKIPYYIGHLNDHHKDTANAWIVRRQGKITPWTFDTLVDTKASAKNFITRMTSDCSYLSGEKVLAKNSLLYSEYALLNEINTMRVCGERLSFDIKKKMINELFKRQRKVTFKQIAAWLSSEIPGSKITVDDISGVDTESNYVKSSLASYITFKSILGDLVDERPDMIEDIIFRHAVYGREKDMVCEHIKEAYKGLLTDEQLKKIKGLNFADFGKLSYKFLNGIHSTSVSSGARLTLIETMRLESKNLNEIYALSESEYDFKKQVDAHNKEYAEQNQVHGYDAVKNLYISPMVKRGVWQTIKIIEELISLNKGKAPDKIFVETTRADDEKMKGQRTKSRQKQLSDLYKAAEKEGAQLAALTAELDKQSESALRGDRLYLYFTQLGRCAYTGEPISLSSINSDFYDIDHIYPQSKLKDDSLSNRVLVTKSSNMRKGDVYPIAGDVRAKNAAMWAHWLKCGLISKEKFARLTRNSPLSDDELAVFVNRQLVATAQSAIAVIELLKVRYPEIKIVYAKARNVSDFRKKFDLVKCRDVNDLHHAKDAYLNIVVGNVFNAKFGYRGGDFFKNRTAGESYKTDKLFEYDVKGAWTASGGQSIAAVKKVMGTNRCLVVQKSLTEKGAYYDETIYGKGSGKDMKELIPLKGNPNNPLSNPEKYGGYNSGKGAYFTVIEYDNKKGVRERAFEQIPVMCSKKIGGDPDKIAEYFAQAGYKNVKVINPKIRMRALLEIDGALVYLNGRTGSRIILCNANQWHATPEISSYIRLLSKFKEKFAAECEDTQGDLLIPAGERSKRAAEVITREQNLALYDEITGKLSSKPFCNLPGMSGMPKKLTDKLSKFNELSTNKQVSVLAECVKLLQTNVTKSNLSLIGEGANVGSLLSNKVLSGDIYLINQSVTGIFEKKVRLSL